MHSTIQAFADGVVAKHGQKGECALLFPSLSVASCCRDFIARHSQSVSGEGPMLEGSRASNLSLLNLVFQDSAQSSPQGKGSIVVISALLFHEKQSHLARRFWQHSGEGISSRRAEYFYPLFLEGHLQAQWINPFDMDSEGSLTKGPRRYQKAGASACQNHVPVIGVPLTRPPQGTIDDLQFIEERFGRNLDTVLASNAKQAIRRRIEAAVQADLRHVGKPFLHGEQAMPSKLKVMTENDVYLYATGMSSIFNIHRAMLRVIGPLKCIMFGFVDSNCEV